MLEDDFLDFFNPQKIKFPVNAYQQTEYEYHQ
jgi:hypothetical protein